MICGQSLCVHDVFGQRGVATGVASVIVAVTKVQKWVEFIFGASSGYEAHGEDISRGYKGEWL